VFVLAFVMMFALQRIIHMISPPPKAAPAPKAKPRVTTTEAEAVSI
jgi:hypothetical protein